MMMLVFGWIIKKWSEAQQKKRENMLQWRRNTLSALIVKMKKIAFLKWKREWNGEKIEIDACIFSTAPLLPLKVTFVTFLFRLYFVGIFPCSFSLHFLFCNASYHHEKLLISLFYFDCVLCFNTVQVCKKISRCCGEKGKSMKMKMFMLDCYQCRFNRTESQCTVMSCWYMNLIKNSARLLVEFQNMIRFFDISLSCSF